MLKAWIKCGCQSVVTQEWAKGGKEKGRERERRRGGDSEGGRGGVRWRGRERKRKRLWKTRNKGREGEGMQSDTEAQGCPISQGSASPLGQRVRPDPGEGVKSLFETGQQASPPHKGPPASHCYSKSALSLFYGSRED